MRIVAGYLGGRVFESPASTKTHPMAERVRGGIFNALGDISSLAVLDAFAGSGALGFEALSRGAARVVAVESDMEAQRAITKNAVSLGVVADYKLIAASVGSWIASSEATNRYDIVFADPPYDNLQLGTVASLAARTKQSGVLVLSWPGKEPIPLIPGMALAKQKAYGDAQVIYYLPEDTAS